MITLSPAAVAEVKLRLKDTNSVPVVRLGFKPGGCAGQKYTIEIGATPAADDASFPHDDLNVVCNRIALTSLNGLRVDFSDALMGGGFTYDNPSAGGACGCGSSFKPLQGLGIFAPSTVKTN